MVEAIDGGVHQVEHVSSTTQASAQWWLATPPAASIEPRATLPMRSPMPNYAAEFVQAHNPVRVLSSRAPCQTYAPVDIGLAHVLVAS